MTITDLQTALGVPADGKFGPVSRAALLAAFVNINAPAISDSEFAAFALKLGCTARQLRAVAAVESGGGGFDTCGRPKMLFERHIFARLTHGQFSPAPYSQASGGGYDEPSWDKLAKAAGKDPDAAFSSASWGKFQVLGIHWQKLGYASAFDLAQSTVRSEAAHFDLLCRYIQTFGLTTALRALSANPETCRDFAKLYNGPGYRTFRYHLKLAEQMR